MKIRMALIIMGIFIGTTTKLVYAQNHGIKFDHSKQKVSTESMHKKESCSHLDPRC